MAPYEISDKEKKKCEERKKKKQTEMRKNFDDLTTLDASKNKPEDYIKEILPQFTLKNFEKPKDSKKEADGIDPLGYPVLDYEESAGYGQSRYAKMIRYY